MRGAGLLLVVTCFIRYAQEGRCSPSIDINTKWVVDSDEQYEAAVDEPEMASSLRSSIRAVYEMAGLPSDMEVGVRVAGVLEPLTTTTTAGPTSTPPPTTAAPPPPSQDSGGDSTVAWVALGSLGGLVVLGGLAWYFWPSRKKADFSSRDKGGKYEDGVIPVKIEPPPQQYRPPPTAPQYQAPAPQYQAPAPQYQAPTQVYQAPAPQYQAPPPPPQVFQVPPLPFPAPPQPAPTAPEQRKVLFQLPLHARVRLCVALKSKDT